MERLSFDPLEAPVCKRCGSAVVEMAYLAPLCTERRSNLVRRPIPMAIIAVSDVVVLLLLVAFARFPASIAAGIDFERGRSAENPRQYVVATAHYRRVSQQFPGSTLALARLGLAVDNLMGTHIR